MAMYICDNCDSWCDDDWNPMVEHPWAKRFPKYKDTTVCNECSIDLEDVLYEAMREDAQGDTKKN